MMRLALVAWAALAAAATLSEVCTLDNVKASLPADGMPADPAITLLPNSFAVNAVTGYNVSGAAYNFCNVTFGYTHPDAATPDAVHAWYFLPEPDAFRGRFLATGGGGFAISSGQRALAGGLPHGAVAGTTDGGLGGFGAQLPDRVLRADGDVDENILALFAFRAIHEMTVLGQRLAANFYAGSANGSRVFSYYSGCSEGGREGLSQVQRFGSQFDGAVVGAPAIRFAQLQVLHLYSPVVEIMSGYVPSSCEVSAVVSHVIRACDKLDGRADGVVSRTDLCMMSYNVSSAVGAAFACNATTGGGGGPMGGAPAPAIQGTVSEEAAAVVAAIWAGMVDDDGKRVYVSFPPTAVPGEASGIYNNSTKAYRPSSSSIGVQWVNYFLKEVRSNSLSLDNATLDTLREFVVQGIEKYSDTLQTNSADLSDFRDAGSKLIHYHGESDDSIPPASSVLYYESVRKAMYPDLSFNESVAAMDGWYRFYLVPGAGHCGASRNQPNGPFPSDALDSLISWVEDGTNPERLHATVAGGTISDKDQELCSWPLRPFWTENGTTMNCLFDQVSIDSWLPALDSIPGGGA
jgi:tannase